MNQNKSQQKSDIFEMRLSSVLDDSVKVKAKIKNNNENVIDNWDTNTKEGQLAVDVYETDDDVIVITTMAGAQTDKIEVYVHSHDLLTIRGIRIKPIEDENINIVPVHKECFWGKFSRTVVLPSDVNSSESKAEYRNGLLTIIIPKQRSSAIPIEIVED